MYAELKCRSNFSFLLGASHPEEVINQAVELGLSGLALSDRDGVYGLPKAYRMIKDHPNFKFICGAEITLKGHPDLILLAKTRRGYGLLTRLLTLSHADKEKGISFLEWEQLLQALNGNDARDLVCIPQVQKETKFQELKDIFGEGLVLPLTRYLDGKDRGRTSLTLKLKKKFDLPIVATNDVYYHLKERKILQDILISIKEGKPLKDIGFKLLSNSERYIKTYQQMEILYKDIPEALPNTLKVADSCKFSMSELRYQYPSEWIPKGHTAQSFLEKLVWKNASSRYPNGVSQKMQEQICHELALIDQLQYADYFLTIYDIVEFAKARKILCQGRGAAANSVVCYILGITAIDPIQMSLLFERFISIERGEPPDIDVDFEHERREEVIQYIYEKYGRHRAAMVSAVITYKKRSAFREICKAFGIDVGTLSTKKVERNFDKLAAGIDIKNLREKIDSLSEQLHGFPRHLSIHSGGFSLSAGPIIEIVPVEPARMEKRTIIQWDKYDLDILGLLKIDILSLGMLTALRKTLDLVGKELSELPPDDKPTYAMIQKADTVGTFQIESRAQISMLGRLLPQNFYDLVIEVAIVRPGPIMGEMVHPYLKRRRGVEKVEYPHPAAKAILEKTLGVPLFQEQVMKLAISLAGFTPGEADELRRAIGTWRSTGSINEIGKKLIKGLLKSGLPSQFVDRIFKQIQGFSEYGFPESHAASFALLAYASCFLKCHYPAEFLCSLINSQPMGFYSVHTLIYDGQRHGVDVLAVSPNLSIWDCHLIEENGVKKIRLGFRVVKGVGKKDVENLIEERKRHGAFRDLANFIRRTSFRQDVLHRMAMAGAFNEFKIEPRDALWFILEDYLLTHSFSDQLSLFHSSRPLPELAAGASSFASLNSFEKIQEDYTAYSLSTHGHPMSVLRKMISRIPQMTAEEAKKMPAGKRVSVGGLLIVRQRPPTAKGVTFSTLEDETGFLDLIFHPKVAEKYGEIYLNHAFVIISGELQRDSNTVNVLVKSVRPIWDERSSDETPLPISVTQYFH